MLKKINDNNNKQEKLAEKKKKSKKTIHIICVMQEKRTEPSGGYIKNLNFVVHVLDIHTKCHSSKGTAVVKAVSHFLLHFVIS